MSSKRTHKFLVRTHKIGISTLKFGQPRNVLAELNCCYN